MFVQIQLDQGRKEWSRYLFILLTYSAAFSPQNGERDLF